MEERFNFFVGLDAHKDSISIASCEAGREAARFVGTIGPDVRGLFEILEKAGEPAQVSVVYEAGPTGYGLYRELLRRGSRSEVIVPSLIPKRAGVRIKNDRRDCGAPIILADRPCCLTLPTTAFAWPNCRAPASSRRSGFQTKLMKRWATCGEPGRTQ